jgi:ABC-type glutathione transport system ATPase component
MSPSSVSPKAAGAPLLEFAGVGSRRREGEREAIVLDGVYFALEPGASLGIYGQRRSGKSTLLRLAVGLELPEEGDVRFDGRAVASMSSGERARLLRGPVALLTANGWLPSPGETVMDHVAMSAGSAGLSLRDARRRALAALDRAGVAAASAEEMTVSLAADTRARVMLARALVREPRLLAVDEPAPMPSLLERERFCALLREVAKERSIALLMASEELSALQGTASLASLSAGELCSTGNQGTVVEFPRRRAGAFESS